MFFPKSIRGVTQANSENPLQKRAHHTDTLIYLKGVTMRKLLFVFLILPTLAFGSGTIQFKPGYFVKAEKVGGQIGVSIWEKVASNLYFSQWLGVGVQPRYLDDSVTYAVSESSFGMWFGKVGTSLGYKFQHADKNVGELLSEHGVYLKLSYKLW